MNVKMFYYYLQVICTITIGVCGLILFVAGICYGKVLSIAVGALGIAFPIVMKILDKEQV